MVRRMNLNTPLRYPGGKGKLTDFIKLVFEQNGLLDGSQVELNLAGKTMTVEATPKRRYKLADLMAEMPDGLPRVDGWEETPDVGLEVG